MKKNRIIIFFIVLLLIVLGLCILTKYIVNKTPSVYYRTYTKEKGWSKWVKDGKTSGNLKNDITNIQIKLKKDNKGIIYNIYTKDWQEESYNVDSKIKNSNIKGIKISLMDKNYKKYDIYYRTYNEDNKWLEWASDYQISGNKNKNIKGIEIKIIPKNVVQKDYLTDFEKTSNNASVGY